MSVTYTCVNCRRPFVVQLAADRPVVAHCPSCGKEYTIGPQPAVQPGAQSTSSAPTTYYYPPTQPKRSEKNLLDSVENGLSKFIASFDKLDDAILSRRKTPSVGYAPQAGQPAPSSPSYSSPVGVQLKSAINYEHAKVVYKVKVENATSSAISEIRVKPIIPRSIFIADSDENTIPLIRPNQSKTVTFTLRPCGECGNVDLSAIVTYYDNKTDSYEELKIKPKATNIICPMIRCIEIDEQAWRDTVSQMISVEETTANLQFSCEELFKIVSDVVRDMNMYMLKSDITITSRRRVARFYCEGIKGLKYAVKVESIGGLQKSKLIIKAYAQNQESLTGFYHKILDEIQERVNVKEYISDALIVHGDYYAGSKIDIKDSVVQRSNIGGQKRSGQGPKEKVEWMD